MEDFNQETASAPIMPTALRYGLIGGLITIIWGMASIFLGWSNPNAGAMSYLSTGVVYLINIGIIAMALAYHRDTMQNGFLTFGEGLKTAIGVMLIVGVIAAIFTFVYTQFINPGFMDEIISGMEAKFEAQGMSR